MQLTKVIFTPKKRAPVNCKPEEYIVNEQNWDLAIVKAQKVFKLENKLYRYYNILAANVRVIE